LNITVFERAQSFELTLNRCTPRWSTEYRFI